MITVITNYSGNESDSEEDLSMLKHEKWSSEAILLLPLDFPTPPVHR